MMPRPVTIDFETKGIESRPKYPPEPVGVSIKKWGCKSQYYAWGHRSGNNCTKAQAIAALRKVWNQHLLFHNAKFDVDVAEEHLGLERPAWNAIHDTVFLLFLNNPHSLNLGLKHSANQLLKIKPEEQDAVKEWLLTNQPLLPAIRISAQKKKEHYWARYICEAPVKIVGPYANGDVDRTAAIFKHLWPVIKKRNMLSAYNRERELMPILLENERQGIRVDKKRLHDDLIKYTAAFRKVEQQVFKILKCVEFNIDSSAELRDALVSAGKLDLDLLGLTPTGKPKADKESLKSAMSDPVLAAVLQYRSQLKTCLRNFIEPWDAMSQASNGYIYTWWNQTRTEDFGARTGRLSSTPNFQNIPNTFKPIFRHDDPSNKSLPIAPRGLKPPALPDMRSYIIPWNKDHVLIDRDYSQQEIRILGHFEDGPLLEAYLEDPWRDIHETGRQLVNRLLRRQYERKPIKNTIFGLIYGMGLGTLAENSNITVDEARNLKNAILKIFPGLQDLMRTMKERAHFNEPIRTWGGREYYCEPPIWKGDRKITFDYKMLNVLIQGSAADCTKQAIINYYRLKGGKHKFYLTVHDEVLVSVPKSEVGAGMNLLREAMEDVTFDLPMLSEGTYSKSNWAHMKDYDVKGVAA